MARRDIQSDRVVRSAPASAESVPSRRNDGWFEEFARVTFDLSMTLNRTVVLSAIIALGAFALVYWGAYTEHYYVMAGAMAVFALAMLVFGFANCYVLYKVVVGSIKWWTDRLNGTGQKDNA